jgi:hypothetical protein
MKGVLVSFFTKSLLPNISLKVCLILGLFLLGSCARKYQKGTIYMGSGGGFTGAWQEYQLNANGKLFKKNSKSDSTQYLFTLDSTTTKQYFKRYYKLKIDKKSLNAPGNAYFYMGHKVGKFSNKKITFGSADTPVSNHIKKLFDDFMKIVETPGPLLE